MNENFELLKKKSNITQLLKLIENKNSVVVCYSSFALIDKNYNQIEKITYLVNDGYSYEKRR